ncbi:hypothetical protein A2276_03135 [candidate division WOR-1 bacterium RIFOXYA12_FULL_43_27]|uniref:Glycosyltransferase RgtA/B/C/D-like domain-containing protein n=1 Tax=candidate division WOR-1 bacterium RIFOXYC2_FULL_46_14 TaxID=1802587 RepID=A0A1F4U9B8_UNCSA|nr:MAG: hypothetical protein A2276_03135 [candidate division WOR-1 bacterium RIFOXYA12_FULL_43_27]OGC19303.1 MAG: hypothetical protein A2292_01200 [candidate division WOR-1 bacterium RIFOXYB2_FULL_46_45]OGC30292.1 MAG: hypothetical protein A2232_01200 [candidate division WOR-1 bacterium RIFOXYA2_FULL_46_56]OGC40893.1 MAG: hypothetical protein A2438_01200 [candidate division WOR-1 bacterium RIFOXYC2_FULL_46_14]
MHKKTILLKILLIISISLFTISLFKNISFPLLWNDESETAMMAKHVLAFGYPKIHDGKNMVYHFTNAVGMNKKYDANLNCTWTSYYFAAIGESLARGTDNLYAKTALLRIPFALLGLLGVLIFALGSINVFEDNNKKLLFLNLFFLFEFFSVPLLLHLKEARYYSVIVFLVAFLFFVYFKYIIFKKISFISYFLSTIVLLFFLFNTFYPAFFIFIATACAHQFFLFAAEALKAKNTIRPLFFGFAKKLSPLIASLLLMIPFMVFFRIFEISRSYHTHKTIDLASYFNNLHNIWKFFENYDFIYLALSMKIILLFFLAYFIKNKITFPINQKLQISNFLTLFLFVYMVIVARMPYFFQRYFIVLQPILIIILLLDGFSIFEYLKHYNQKEPTNKIKRIVPLSIIAIFAFGTINLIPVLNNHLYELFHQYKGPLDFVIPHIKENYTNPENLIIATNYEETSYMYYLGSKTIIGFVYNNLEEDLKEEPDIIIPRKAWGNNQMLKMFFKKNRYNKKTFPVFDYLFNNIPEMSYHLFETEFAQNDNEGLAVYTKKNSK